MTSPLMSADSHVAEPNEAYLEIDPAFRDRAPHLVHDDELGAGMVVDGLPAPVPMSFINAAGRKPEDIGIPVVWERLDPAGHDSAARLAHQDREGIACEVIFPSVGMMLCRVKDIDYRKACNDAYNRWLASFCEADPSRLLGLATVTLRSIEEGIEELRTASEMGFRGVMFPGNPNVEDYDHPCYDPLWEAAIDLKLPIHFHILTSDSDDLSTIIIRKSRGPKITQFMSIIRGVQDILLMLIFSGVFERHPGLRVVCAEADAGWAPHFAYRMDHAYERHRYWLETSKLPRPPSHYFRENIYLTFQDDYAATHTAHLGGSDRLMWASDFPHSDGTFPRTQEVIERLTGSMSEAMRDGITGGNMRGLYGLDNPRQ
ncbi:amidohydrolase [Myxococcota bacterium]|nr:amidohydrolase [Myxococcota bacterium]